VGDDISSIGSGKGSGGAEEVVKGNNTTVSCQPH